MKAGEKQRTPRKESVLRVLTIPALLRVVTCPSCGAEVDLWTKNEETRCSACDQVIHKRQWTNH